MTKKVAGPDNSKNVVHNVYPGGLKLTPEQLDPKVGGWLSCKHENQKPDEEICSDCGRHTRYIQKTCYHVYHYIGEKVCSICGRDTHEIDWELQNKINKQWLKDNPDAWRQVGWWSI